MKCTLSKAFSSSISKGFTLVELMVAMLLLGIFSTLLYGMFATSSSALSEADSLADTISKAQFALQHVRKDLMSAGSQSTPDSLRDPFVQPKDSANLVRVVGILPYGDPGQVGTAAFWQNKAAPQTQLATANPDATFDGFIIIGAIDHQQSILVTGVEEDSGEFYVHILNEPRGLHRLVITDPFRVSADPPFAAFDPSNVNHQELFNSDMTTRLIRITDRQGYMQFARIEDTDIVQVDRCPGTPPCDALQLKVDNLAFRQPGQVFGLDPLDNFSDDSMDVEYEAALIDAYWYRVLPDPMNARNFILVRDRLDLTALTDPDELDNQTADLDLSSLDPLEFLPDPVQRVIIADRVADFQVWFSCTNNAEGNLDSAPWQVEWTEASGGACMQTTAAEPVLARMAHMRLSLRTAHARPDKPHAIAGTKLGFEDTAASAPMRTFDIEPRSTGATRVVTVQTSFELPVFSMRNVR